MRKNAAAAWAPTLVPANLCSCGTYLPSWVTRCGGCSGTKTETRFHGRDPGWPTRARNHRTVSPFESRGRDRVIPARTIDGEPLSLYGDVSRRDRWNAWYLRLTTGRVSPVGFELPDGEEKRAPEVWCRLEDRLLADLREAGVVS